MWYGKFLVGKIILTGNHKPLNHALIIEVKQNTPKQLLGVIRCRYYSMHGINITELKLNATLLSEAHLTNTSNKHI